MFLCSCWRRSKPLFCCCIARLLSNCLLWALFTMSWFLFSKRFLPISRSYLSTFRGAKVLSFVLCTSGRNILTVLPPNRVLPALLDSLNRYGVIRSRVYLSTSYFVGPV